MSTLLVDFSNLAYTCFFAALSNDGLKSDAVPKDYSNFLHIFQRKFEHIQNQVRATKSIFALDHKPTGKYDIFPEYKQSRKTRTLEFNPKPKLMNMIHTWPCATLEAVGYEADDVIASYVAQFHEDEEIVVASTDKDMWQVLDHPNTRVYNFFSNEFVETRHLEKAFEITQYKHIKLVKALFGDSGDGVRNLVPRMGRYLTPIIRDSDGTIEDLTNKVKIKEKAVSARCMELFNGNYDKILVNYELVKLKYNCKIEVKHFPTIPGYAVSATQTESFDFDNVVP